MPEPRSLSFQEVNLEYVENTIDFGAFEPVINELANDFATVRVSRCWAGPMATPLFGDVAIVFILGAASGAFLAELGKDIYRGLRAGFFALYESAKTWANGRGYTPFAIEETLDGPRSAHHFTFPAGLDREQFDDAVLTIPDAIADYSGTSGLVGFVYEDGCWHVRATSIVPRRSEAGEEEA